jgi:hypothetical protein
LLVKDALEQVNGIQFKKFAALLLISFVKHVLDQANGILLKMLVVVPAKLIALVALLPKNGTKCKKYAVMVQLLHAKIVKALTYGTLFKVNAA